MALGRATAVLSLACAVWTASAGLPEAKTASGRQPALRGASNVSQGAANSVVCQLRDQSCKGPAMLDLPCCSGLTCTRDIGNGEFGCEDDKMFQAVQNSSLLVEDAAAVVGHGEEEHEGEGVDSSGTRDDEEEGEAAVGDHEEAEEESVILKKKKRKDTPCIDVLGGACGGAIKCCMNLHCVPLILPGKAECL